MTVVLTCCSPIPFLYRPHLFQSQVPTVLNEQEERSEQLLEQKYNCLNWLSCCEYDLLGLVLAEPQCDIMLRPLDIKSNDTH